MSGFALIGFLAAMAWLQVPPDLVVVPDEEFALDPRGRCSTGNGTLAMDDIYLLESDVYKMGEGERRAIIRIERETLRIQDPSGGIRVHDVDDFVSPDADVDIQLRFALVRDEVLLYWRETFQNRIYKMGLISFENGRLRSYCNGEGGLEVSH